MDRFFTDAGETFVKLRSLVLYYVGEETPDENKISQLFRDNLSVGRNLNPNDVRMFPVRGSLTMKCEYYSEMQVAKRVFGLYKVCRRIKEDIFENPLLWRYHVNGIWHAYVRLMINEQMKFFARGSFVSVYAKIPEINNICTFVDTTFAVPEWASVLLGRMRRFGCNPNAGALNKLLMGTDNTRDIRYKLAWDEDTQTVQLYKVGFHKRVIQTQDFAFTVKDDINILHYLKDPMTQDDDKERPHKRMKPNVLK
jgi:hypothetical protein